LTGNKSIEAGLFFDSRPVHLRAKEAIETLLEGYNPGERIPSEQDLSKAIGISRATVRELLSTLEAHGRIIKRHGIGTFIASNKPVFESGLENLESLDAFANRMGFECQIEGLKIWEAPVEPTIAGKLNIEEGSTVTLVARTRLIQGVTIAFMIDVLPASLVSKAHLEPVFTGSVLDYLKDNINPGPTYAVTYLFSIPADEDLAKKMQVNIGHSLLLLEETLFSGDDSPLNYSRRYYNTRYFHYHMIRRNNK